MSCTDRHPGLTRKFARALAVSFAVGFLASCAAVDPPVTTALPAGDPSQPRTSPKPYRAGLVPAPTNDGASGNSKELLVLVAISGGGKRSAAFSYGVLQTLSAATVDIRGLPHPVMDEVDLISGVSGGAFTAAYYALHRDAMFAKRDLECSYENSFLYANFESYIWGLYLLPWHWGWMFDGSYGSNDEMARHYAEHLFSGARPTGDQCIEPKIKRAHGVTFGDLYDVGPPVLMIGATDITKGFVFPFNQDGFDLLCADLSDYPLAWAVAASNGFPPVLSSISLENHHNGDCRPANKWLLDIDLSPSRSDSREPDVVTFERDKLLEDVARQYLKPGTRKFAHAMDGGITDNLALRGLSDWITMHSDQMGTVLGQTKRILLIVIDGQSTLDPKTAESEAGPQFFDALNALISTSIDQYNVETLATAKRELDKIVGKIAEARPNNRPPTAQMVHLTIREDCNTVRRDNLLGLGTSLGLSSDDVDALIEAGREIADRHMARITSALDLERETPPVRVTCPVEGHN